jgi:hypothetical protein
LIHELTLSRTAQTPHKHETRSHTSALQHTHPNTNLAPQTPAHSPSTSTLPLLQQKRTPSHRAGQPKANSPPQSPAHDPPHKHEEEAKPATRAQSRLDSQPPTISHYSKNNLQSSPIQSSNSPSSASIAPSTSTTPATPPTPPLSDYHFVSDSSLCKSFEEDHAFLAESNYDLVSSFSILSPSLLRIYILQVTDTDTKKENNTSHKTKIKKTKYKTKTKNNNASIKKNSTELENSSAANGDSTNGTTSTLKVLSFPERMLLAKYAACYCNAIPDVRVLLTLIFSFSLTFRFA